MSFLRALVSKEKRRYIEHGYNLDLTYITSRIIAMGFPSKAGEAIYRNPHDEVLKFLEEFHHDHYKIYNLCSESNRTYDTAPFCGRVERYPFDDHNAPPLELLAPFVRSVDEWFAAHPDNVIAIHCKAGKGRTGCFICIYLLHSGICATADEAMDFYGIARTKNSKGLTIPSQRRYVHYYERILRQGLPTRQILKLTSVRFSSVPNISGGGIAPFFTVKCGGQTLESKDSESKTLQKFTAGKDTEVLMDVRSRGLFLCNDVKLEMFHKGFSKTKVLHFWFHTSFIENNILRITKPELDGPPRADKKHKTYPRDFFVELLFEPATEADAAAAGVAAPFAEKIEVQRVPVSPSAGDSASVAAVAAAAERDATESGVIDLTAKSA